MGTHDVSLLTIDDGVFEVKATSGISTLGGEDFDNLIVEHCCKEIDRRYSTDIRSNLRALRRLRTACERAKRTLSTATVASIEVDSLFDGNDFNLQLSRAKFELLCDDLFRKTLEPVEQVLRDSKISKDKIHDIVLVGGSTRIPKIQQLLSDYFGGKELCKSINPDEAVAYGAAVQASILTGVQSNKTDNIVLLDVCPLTLGIEVAGGLCEPIIKRNSVIPTKQSKTFSTYSDNQPGATIQIYQGERSMARDNQKLGQFQLDGIPPMPRGVPQIEVTYELDANGILTVNAQEKSTGKSERLVITSDRNTLSKEQIERMVQEAKENEKEDQRRRETIEAKNQLEGYLFHVKQSLRDEKVKDKIVGVDRDKLTELVEQGINWLDSHPNETKESYEEKKKELEEQIMPVFAKMYQNGAGMDNTMPGGMPATSESKAGPRVDEVD